MIVLSIIPLLYSFASSIFAAVFIIAIVSTLKGLAFSTDTMTSVKTLIRFGVGMFSLAALGFLPDQFNDTITKENELRKKKIAQSKSQALKVEGSKEDIINRLDDNGTMTVVRKNKDKKEEKKTVNLYDKDTTKEKSINEIMGFENDLKKKK